MWLEDAFDRATQLYLSYYRSIPKSLERSTAHKLMLAMLNHDERFVEPSPHSLQKLTLQSVKDAVMNQFVGGNMEVCELFFSFLHFFSSLFKCSHCTFTCSNICLIISHIYLILYPFFQVSIVGDFTEEEVESCVLDYLGTVRAASSPNTEERIEKISFRPFPSDVHFQEVWSLLWHPLSIFQFSISISSSTATII